MNRGKSVEKSEKSMREVGNEVREVGDKVREVGERSHWWREKSIADKAMEIIGDKERDVNGIYKNAFQFACIQLQVS